MSEGYNYYEVLYDGKTVGYYHTFDDGSSRYYIARDFPEELRDEFRQYCLDEDLDSEEKIGFFTDMIREENLVPGRKQRIYKSGHFTLVREPQWTDEVFYIYRRAADPGDPDYSPLHHDAPHYEGPGTPEDMREWANYYCIRKMDDGTYQAELDEAWWWGGSHNDGGTIHAMIPEEWFGLPYEEFLDNVLSLAAARHYGFTEEILLSRKGLREFFGYGEEKEEDKKDN